MRFGNKADAELDGIDLRILEMLQDDCRTSLARLGEGVGLSAPSVLERIKKLEAAGVITGYHAALDARRLGLDVTAFIGVITSSPDLIDNSEDEIVTLDDVLECHHVTGEYTLLLKVKTANTSSLERLITQIRQLDGVSRTETIVVLSTLAERMQLGLHRGGSTTAGEPPPTRPRRGGERNGQLRRAQ
jgi:Lrp/AsnC family transcriptional regulator, leucine-responsive regulatory protein